MEPRRVALGSLYENFGDLVFDMSDTKPVIAFDAGDLVLMQKMLSNGLNSPLTSSVGRLFDAVASIIGLTQAACRF